MNFAIFGVIIGMISVQVGASLAKGLFPAIGPSATVMLRISFAAIMMALVWRPWRVVLNKKSLRAVLLYGACLGLMNFTFYLALTKIPLGITVALEFTGPLAVALFASKQKIDFLWALLASVGIVLILPLESASRALDPLGIFYALCAGLCWALYIIFGKTVGQLLHGGYAATLGMIVAALVTMPFGVATIHLANFTSNIWLMAAGVALLSSSIPYTIEMFAMKQIPTKTFGILMSVEPAFAALTGLLMLGEKLTHAQWLAIFCVILASGGSATTSRAKKAAPPLI